MTFSKGLTRSVIFSIAVALTGTTAYAQDALATVPELQELLPQSVRDAGVLKIAIPDVGKPLSYSEGDELKGMDPDLARAVSQVLGLEPELNLIPFAAALTGLQASRYDISYGEFYVTAERLKVADFVTNWQDYSSFLVAKSSGYRPVSLDEICDKTIGAMAGSAELEILNSVSGNCAAAPTISAFPSVTNAVLALNSNRVDGVLIGRGAAQESINLDAGLDASGEIGGGPTATAVARNDNSEAMLAAIKGAYDHLIASGDYQRILEQNDTAYGAATEAVIYTQDSTPPDYSF